jgi:hypothetical protein
MQKEVAISRQKDMVKWNNAVWEGIRAGINYIYLWPWEVDDEESN